jgi:hypothetical protein
MVGYLFFFLSFKLGVFSCTFYVLGAFYAFDNNISITYQNNNNNNNISIA